jgi:hypothetical protein
MKSSLATFAALCCALLMLTACPAEMWIPIQTVPRQSTSFDHVQYLDEAPTRPYEVLGIITPPEGEYDTDAEMVRAMRRVGAKHGADAIFIESQSESSGWKFDSGFLGAKGGSTRNVHARAKAIAWK